MHVEHSSPSRRRLMKVAAAIVTAPFIIGRAAAATTILKLNLPASQTDPMSLSSAAFAELVEKHSNGALQIQLFYNGTLGKQQASISGMQTGVIDMTNQTTAWIESLAPRVQALDLPFAFGDAGMAERVLDGPIGQDIANDLANKGVVVLAWATNGWRDLELVAATVTKPEDMRNLKIRIQSGTVYVAMMRALGAVPVVIDFSEVYLALQQKVADGLEIPPPTVLSSKLDEVLKSVSLTHHLYNPAPLMMSKIRYESLPADHQGALRAAAAEVLPVWRRNYTEFEKQALVDLKAKGLAIEQVDRAAFKQAMNPVYDEVRQKVGADFVDRLLKAAA